MSQPKHSHLTLVTTALASALAGVSAVHHWPASEDRYMPEPILTPGTLADVTAKECCRPGYSAEARNVTQATKNAVYARYGIRKHKPGDFEIDHLISIELGGGEEIENLWPQSYSGTWNAHLKDRLEDKLHQLVCNGSITLSEAQHAIRTDWIAAYEKYISN